MESVCGCFTIMKFDRSFVINAVEDITFPSFHVIWKKNYGPRINMKED